MRLSIVHYGKWRYPNNNDVMAPRFIYLSLYGGKKKNGGGDCYVYLVHKYSELLNNMAFKCPFVYLKINNRVFKDPFLAIANVQLRLIRGYKIENARYFWIYNKGKFEAIAKKNNVHHTPIRIRREHMGTHRNTRERTGAHRSARERRYNVQKRPLKMPDKRTNKYAITLWCCCCCYSLFFAVAAEMFWIKIVPLNF